MDNIFDVVNKIIEKNKEELEKKLFKELLEDVKKHQANKGVVCWFNQNGDLEYVLVSRDIFTKDQGDILLLPKPLNEYSATIDMYSFLNDDKKD